MTMTFREYSDYGEFIVFVSGMWVVGILLTLLIKILKWEVMISEKENKRKTKATK